MSREQQKRIRRKDSMIEEKVYQAVAGRRAAGMTLKSLTDAMADGASDRSSARRAVRQALKGLQKSGRIVEGRGKRYYAREHSQLIVGRLRAGHRGLELIPEGGGDTIQVSRKGLRGALDGDLVAVRLERPRRRAREAGVVEGVVVKVLERRHSTIVGRWVSEGVRPHVVPLQRGLRFNVLTRDLDPADRPRHGELVLMSLDSPPGVRRPARGRILERLGLPGEAGVEERAVLHLYEIPQDFAPEVLAVADGIDAEVVPDASRWDLRGRPTITIDPATARDFDDAVNATRGHDGSIVVEVHIADVSHYIKEGSPLDDEAQKRGTSVYFPGLCVPMLPERLSNDLCSLKEGVDRYAYTVRFTVLADGRVGRFEAGSSVIRSIRRLSYDQVFEWIQRPREEWPEETRPFADSLELLDEAAAWLGRRRRDKGSLDFDLPEPVVLLDPEGRMVGIENKSHNRAHRLIEELMVTANECVARILIAAGQPCLHRIHENPDPEKIEVLKEVLAELGIELEGDSHDLPPASLQRVLQAVDGTSEERLVSTLVLRSLKRALYSSRPLGHYALATDAYLHFTSPIRRYPDLVVHRMLRRLQLEGHPLPEEEKRAQTEKLEQLGEWCSETEQRAEGAERTVIQWKKVVFMRDRVGEVFDAHITGVTDFGLFVQLDEVLVEGLVHISSLADDFYHFEERKQRLVGERTGKSFRLGDRLSVQLERVDLDAMRLDFGPVGLHPDREAIRRRRKR